MKKNIILTLFLLAICLNAALALPQSGHVELTSPQYSFSEFDIKKTLKNADANMLMYQKVKDKEKKKEYLENAMRYYFIASKIDDKATDAFVGIARVYDEMKLDTLAKEHFYKATNLDYKNAKANFYFGNFYFKRNDFLNALKYYKIAYANGYSKNYQLNLTIGIIYEKLADIETAKIFYLRALKLKQKNNLLYEKIRLLEELNYSDSQYYLFKR